MDISYGVPIFVCSHNEPFGSTSANVFISWVVLILLSILVPRNEISSNDTKGRQLNQ